MLLVIDIANGWILRVERWISFYRLTEEEMHTIKWKGLDVRKIPDKGQQGQRFWLMKRVATSQSGRALGLINQRFPLRTRQVFGSKVMWYTTYITNITSILKTWLHGLKLKRSKQQMKEGVGKGETNDWKENEDMDELNLIILGEVGHLENPLSIHL